MKRLMSCLLVVALCGIVRGDDKDDKEAEALVKGMVESVEKFVKLLESVKDKDSAETARPELEKVAAGFEETQKALMKLGPDQRKKLQEAMMAKGAGLFIRLNSEMERIRKDEALSKVLADVGPFKQLGGAREQVARARALVIEKALDAYKLTNSEYPASLEDLTKGDKPFIKAADLKDPWGKTYQYDAKGPKNKGVKPDVWTVDPKDKVIGNWVERPEPPKDKPADKPKDKPADKPADKPDKDK